MLGGRSSLCPRALRDGWFDEFNKEVGLSVKVPILETEGCVTESETGLTDTAEPAAAAERQDSKTDFYAYLLYIDISQYV